MGEQAKKSFIINIIFLSLWVGIFIISAKFLFEYMLPFVIAIVVAAAMQKPAKVISKVIKIPKGVCAALLSAVLYIALASAIIFAVAKFSAFASDLLLSLSGLGDTLTDLFSAIENTLGKILSNISSDFQADSNKILSAVVESIIQKLSLFVSESAAKIVKSTPSFLFSSIVALAASCYIAKDFDALIKFVKGLLAEKTTEKISEITEILKSNVFKIIGGYLILMVITFAELAVGLLALEIKNWLTIAFITAVIDVLPVLGVGAVLLPWGIINIILGNTSLGVWLMILYLIIVIIRNFAEPKIVGSKTGINPLFILFTMFLGIKLFGMIGLIILPVTFIVIIKYYKSEMENEPS